MKLRLAKRQDQKSLAIIEDYSQDGAEWVLVFFLPLKLANIWSMDVCNQQPVRVPKMDDQEVLTLR